MKISGKVALVSGGASGIGKAVSSKLLENGAKLVAILDLDAESGKKTISEFSEKFGADRVKFIQCDVTQEDQLKNSFQAAFDVFGALDIVLNNAGVFTLDNRKTIEVNLMAVINATFIAEKLMTKEKRSEKGVIVNTASMAGLRTSPTTNASYVASKHGVVGFTRTLVNSIDAFSKDLRAVAICPAAVETDLWTRYKIDYKTKEVEERVEAFKAKEGPLDIDMVVNAFMLAIEDDNLHGALIKVRGTTGIEVVKE